MASSEAAAAANQENDVKSGDDEKSSKIRFDYYIPSNHPFDVHDDDKDPGNLVSQFVGLWGNKLGTYGTCEVFVGLEGPWGGKKGFTIPYVESWTCFPAPGIVLNPSQFSKKELGGKEGELLYGVRFVREIWSKLEKKDYKDNPFKKNQVLHFETGYILFCYYGNPDDKKSQKLVRVVKTLAVPRATTVIAHDDNPTIDVNKEGNGKFEYTLKAEAASAENLVWIVGNGEFSQKTAKVMSFSQECKIKWKEGLGTLGIDDGGLSRFESTFEYVQKTPLKFIETDGQPLTIHTNKNKLVKGDYPVVPVNAPNTIGQL